MAVHCLENTQQRERMDHLYSIKTPVFIPTLNNSDPDTDALQETQNVTETFTIKASDGSSTKSDNLTFNIKGGELVLNVSSLSIMENVAGSTIGTVTPSDNIGVVEYSLGSSGDNDYFEFFGSTLKLKNGVSADYETKSSYDITVSAKLTTGTTLTKNITLSVQGQNEAPIVSDTRVEIDQDANKSFSSSDFSFSDSDSGDTLNKIQIVRVLESSSGNLLLSGESIADGKEISASELSNLSYSPVAGEYGNNYAQIFYRVHDGTTYSDQVGTMTIDVSKKVLGPIALLFTLLHSGAIV